ncbi:MAG: hypothetical protein EBR30_12780 [Cytophagia bacterium]|nr:hypothetical protein [Cytophagia bacterium]
MKITLIKIVNIKHSTVVDAKKSGNNQLTRQDEKVPRQTSLLKKLTSFLLGLVPFLAKLIQY